jgi:hypothetical protein
MRARRILGKGLFAVVGRLDNDPRLSQALLDKEHQVAVVLDV